MNGNNQQEKVNQYGQNMNPTDMMNGMDYGNAPAPGTPTPGFVLWLVVSIAQMMCCNQITGLICIVLTILADSDFKKGVYGEYNSKMRLVKILTVVGVVIGLAVLVVWFLLMGISILAEL